jgi:hypothetical protein
MRRIEFFKKEYGMKIAEVFVAYIAVLRLL